MTHVQIDVTAVEAVRVPRGNVEDVIYPAGHMPIASGIVDERSRAPVHLGLCALYFVLHELISHQDCLQ